MRGTSGKTGGAEASALQNLAAVADARFQALAHALDDAVVVADALNIVRFANPAADRLFEASDGLAGKPFLLPLAATPPGLTTLALPSGRRAKTVMTVATTVWEGGVAWLATFKPRAPLVSEMGALVDDALTVMRSRFLAHVSHELRTPLNSIVGFAELMALEPHGPLGRDEAAAERYRGYAEDIRESGRRLSALMSDLLDLARAEAGELRIEESRFDLGPLLAEVLPEAEASARLRAARPRLGRFEPVTISGDRERIKRALVHLVANGLSFAEEGEVTLSATLARDGRVRIAVDDQGPGFSPNALARAGEPFGRARDDVDLADPRAGIGVGLAVARHMFELHGGGLRIDSRDGQGARVTCTLPHSRVVRGRKRDLRH